ncbi:MAG: porin family protein [Gammaproteobacteria bacterium]|nr:porin family protein [Gammaproteobacteria bacterium]HJP05447.1 porin family protein [Gammaproteobacteria bacterium]
MKKHLVFAGILICLSLGAQADNSESSGWYVGGSLGLTSVDDDGKFDDQQFDDSDGAYGFFGGYRFNDFFAAESRWMELGEYRRSEPLIDTDTMDATSISINLVGIIPVGDKWELSAQVGAASVDVSCDSCNRETGTTAGFAASYRTSPNMSVFLSYDLYNYEDDVGGTEFDMDIDVTQFGLRYNFE